MSTKKVHNSIIGGRLFDEPGRRIYEYVGAHPEGSSVNEILSAVGGTRHPLMYRLLSMHCDGIILVKRGPGKVTVYPMSVKQEAP